MEARRDKAALPKYRRCVESIGYQPPEGLQTVRVIYHTGSGTYELGYRYNSDGRSNVMQLALDTPSAEALIECGIPVHKTYGEIKI